MDISFKRIAQQQSIPEETSGEWISRYEEVEKMNREALVFFLKHLDVIFVIGGLVLLAAAAMGVRKKLG